MQLQPTTTHWQYSVFNVEIHVQLAFPLLYSSEFLSDSTKWIVWRLPNHSEWTCSIEEVLSTLNLHEPTTRSMCSHQFYLKLVPCTRLRTPLTTYDKLFFCVINFAVSVCVMSYHITFRPPKDRTKAQENVHYEMHYSSMKQYSLTRAGS